MLGRYGLSLPLIGTKGALANCSVGLLLLILYLHRDKRSSGEISAVVVRP